MDTRDALVVDAFAPEPMTGTPVGIVFDGDALDPNQRLRIASEFSASVTAFIESESDGYSLRLPETDEDDRSINVGIAVALALRERGLLSRREESIQMPTGTTISISQSAEAHDQVAVDVPDITETEVTETEVAKALGIDVAAIRDVAADFPLVRASLGSGVLVVPVNFLEHLSRADPDLDAVRGILEASDTESLYAFTFDTLESARDAHGLEVRDAGFVRPTGEAEACAAAAIDQFGALDHDREILRFEAGDLLDRPARLDVEIGERYAVAGPALIVLDGSIVVPPASDGGDIIEV